MKRSKRLLKLLELVPSNSKVVFDVGADHGILSALILNTGKSEMVYASDISEKSLNKTEILAKNLGLEEKLRCIVSDGLDNFDKSIESDMVIIAGMGGNEIVKILTKISDFSKYKAFLLQPAQDFYVLRQYLTTSGYEVVKDEIVEDKGKYYTNIICKKSDKKTTFSEIQLYFGKDAIQDRSVDFIGFVNYTYNKLLAIKEYLGELDLKKFEFCESVLNKNKGR